jgi:hypothetical protein
MCEQTFVLPQLVKGTAVSMPHVPLFSQRSLVCSAPCSKARPDQKNLSTTL